MTSHCLLRVGTDCSGIEAPIQALGQLGIPFRHIFSSEIDKYCIKSIKANYNPEILFGDTENGDIRLRNNSSLPDIDLYVCGFPCQPFSAAGNRLGLEDKRGNIFMTCIDVIKCKTPKYFILENVKGILKNNKGKTWKVILSELEKLRDLGYQIHWKVLNTKDYGIPQNRERVFIIGIKDLVFNFEWPEKTELDDIYNYIDNTDIHSKTIPNYILKCNYLDKIPKYSVFVDFGFKNFYPKNAGEYTSCLLAGHSSNLWCVKYNRFCNVKEWLSLQGFPTDFKQVVSNTQMKKQIGNSMSVNVLKEIFKKILA